MTRSEQRQQILALTYEKTFHDEEISEIIELAEEARDILPSDYVTREVNGIFDNLGQIDTLISENSVGWSIARIARVPLCIMRIAVYEMLYEDDIPAGASINEAVEMAKTYGADKDPSFINGILGSIARKLGK